MAAPKSELSVRNLDRGRRINTRYLRLIARALLEPEWLPRPEVLEAGCELGVYVVSPRQMTRLNEEHLKHKGPTDVIAFNYRPGAERAAGGEPLHGDIFLCLEVARRQARAFRATWQEEMVRYLIHGLLHLQGFDDLDAVSRREMKAIEDRLTRRARGCFRLSRLSPPTRLAT